MTHNNKWGKGGNGDTFSTHFLTVFSLLPGYCFSPQNNRLSKHTTRQKCKDDAASLLRNTAPRWPAHTEISSGTQNLELRYNRNSGTGTQEQKIMHTARLDSPCWCAPPIGQKIDAHKESAVRLELKLLRCCCAHAHQEKLLLLCCCPHRFAPPNQLLLLSCSLHEITAAEITAAGLTAAGGAAAAPLHCCSDRSADGGAAAAPLHHYVDREICA